jgi:hypothetical protein
MLLLGDWIIAVLVHIVVMVCVHVTKEFVCVGCVCISTYVCVYMCMCICVRVFFWCPLLFGYISSFAMMLPWLTDFKHLYLITLRCFNFRFVADSHTNILLCKYLFPFTSTFMQSMLACLFSDNESVWCVCMELVRMFVCVHSCVHNGMYVCVTVVQKMYDFMVLWNLL